MGGANEMTKTYEWRTAGGARVTLTITTETYAGPEADGYDVVFTETHTKETATIAVNGNDLGECRLGNSYIEFTMSGKTMHAAYPGDVREAVFAESTREHEAQMAAIRADEQVKAKLAGIYNRYADR